jgi:hypothetical protein
MHPYPLLYEHAQGVPGAASMEVGDIENDQLRQYYDIWNGEYAPDELLEFAANPQTSASLFVRAVAFERAMMAGRPGHSNQFMRQYAELSQHTSLSADAAKILYPIEGFREEVRVTNACNRLALLGGVDPVRVFPDPKEMSWEHARRY